MIVQETNKSVEITLNDVSRLEDKKLLLIEVCIIFSFELLNVDLLMLA